MRRILTTLVVALAALGALGITASAAEAKRFKTKAFLEEIGDVPPGMTFVFSGHVESKKQRCRGRRKVSIYLAPARVGARGGSFDDPLVVGKTKRDGTFALDSGAGIIIAAPYEARVEKRKPKPGVRCGAAISAPLSPLE